MLAQCGRKDLVMTGKDAWAAIRPYFGDALAQRYGGVAGWDGPSI